MKYRTDFVTNSSSTSFAAALASVVAGIIASCNCNGDTEGENVDDETTNDNIFFQKSVMPEGANKIVQGEDPVYLYAQLVTQTKEELAVIEEATPNITFQAATGGGWLSISPPEVVGDWAAVEVSGISPASDSTPPDQVTIKAKCRHGKKSYSVSFRLAFEAEPALTVKPEKCNFLTKTGDSADFKVVIKNPGPDPWNLTVEGDTWADKICSYSLEEISDKGDKANLIITENDTEETSGSKSDHYSKGRITVRGSNGIKDVEDYCDAYVWREGLFRSTDVGMDQETGELLIKADKGEDGEMKSSTFDLRYMRWDSESKSLKCDTAVFTSDIFSFDDPDPKDDQSEAIFDTCNAVIEYQGERPSNMPSGKFSIKMDKVIPGKQDERYNFSVTATVDDGENYFDVSIPFAIIPAFLTESHSDWQTEYEYCKKIINTFFPESKRPSKLSELENCKHYMGVADLKTYRKECWDIAQDIIIKQRNDYLDDAAWYDWALYTAEWVQWLNDRAFNVVVGSLTGPMGAIVATQGKELIQDCIEKFVTVKSTETWTDIVTGILIKRVQNTVGGAVDAKYFSNPEVSKKWIVSFFVYKWVWHWAFDEENGQRKGCLEGMKAACWDLTGAGLEEKMKPFIGKLAEEGGFKQNMDMDEYITKTAASIKAFINANITVTY